MSTIVGLMTTAVPVGAITGGLAGGAGCLVPNKPNWGRHGWIYGGRKSSRSSFTRLTCSVCGWRAVGGGAVGAAPGIIVGGVIGILPAAIFAATGPQKTSRTIETDGRFIAVRKSQSKLKPPEYAEDDDEDSLG